MRQFDTLAILGIGLLGGSVGLAAKRRGLVRRVVGVARTETTLSLALGRGCADEVTADMATAVRDAGLVIIATPVSAVAEAFERIVEHVPSGALVTDVASTKASICQAADRVFSGRAAFVGGHPMAGDDQTGVANARGHLFEKRVWALTPSSASTAEATAELTAFAKALGARTVELDPQRHDRLVAATSHLPHVVSSALVNAAFEATGGDSLASALTGRGFCDTTRVAAGPADLWDDIISDNAKALLPALDAMLSELHSLRAAVAREDEPAIRAFLEAANERREELVGEVAA